MNPTQKTPITSQTTSAPKTTTIGFATSVRSKYPNGVTSDGIPYSKLSDRELTQRVVEKYPVYKSTITDIPENRENVVKEIAGNTLKNTAESYKNAPADFLKEAGRQDESTSANPLIRTAENALGATASGINTVFAPVTGAIKAVSDRIANNPQIQELVSKDDAVGKVLDLFGHGSDKLESWAQEHPEAARNLNNLLVVGGTALGGKSGIAEKPITSLEQIKTGITKTPEVISQAGKEVIKTGKELIKGTPEANLAKDTIKLQELISPKLTAKEVKLAQSEGRLVSGKEPSMFRSGTPDTIIPSDKVVQATQTIQREIPSASKMKSPELYTALEGRTADMAKNLSPEMRKVPIKPETVEKITNDWTEVKKAQKANAYMPSDVNLKKLQADFEARLQKSDSSSLDDLWETRKAYDTSVPANVKKATSQSSESLQAKKEIWLQNRNILNDAINDNVSGMGETSQKAFSDMSDMYNAKENLLSKAKVLESSPSKIKQWIKDNPWKSAATGYLTGKAIEKTTGINIPAI